MSDIRVSVQWSSSTVFSGEDIECKITFKNDSQALDTFHSASSNSVLRNPALARGRWKGILPAQIPLSQHPKNWNSKKQVLDSFINNNEFKSPSATRNPHRRSVSIVSLAKETQTRSEEKPQRHASPLKRPNQGHIRTASLQIVPGRVGAGGSGPSSASLNGQISVLPYSYLTASTFSAEPIPKLLNKPPSKFDVAKANQTSQKHPPGSSAFRNHSPNFSLSTNAIELSRQSLGSRSTKSVSPEPVEPSTKQEGFSLLSKTHSPISINCTPRSSGDFYNLSTNSTETLASDYPVQSTSNALNYNGRQASALQPSKTNNVVETLIMGYAQITGSFLVDGSLINQACFEDIKAKGIIGSQSGGGFVRADSTKKDNFLFGKLGWSNIGESLGGFLGGKELSSVKEAKNSSNARSIPILSTPQSIIFIDLQLKPGESKTFTFSHPLPKGIPPSHKGRALKVFYNLTIGVQRATTASSQRHVHTVEVPFRILTGVDDQGGLLGYDLMSPHTFLQDAAFVSSFSESQKTLASRVFSTKTGGSQAFAEDFLSYVKATLNRTDQSLGLNLLSPTENTQSPFALVTEAPLTMKDAIDLAILKSTATTPSKRNLSRFEITRDGRPVAVITLTRPVFRLGEMISSTIDLRNSSISCFSLRSFLESYETVDPSIALRSKASIHRATVRVHASQHDITLFTRRTTFNPVVPNSATPDFITSGVSLKWRLRFEFVTGLSKHAGKLEDNDLIEEVAKDERGVVTAAVQSLSCEIFDVSIPLRIYGATTLLDEKIETHDLAI